MRTLLLLTASALAVLSAQTPDPNKSGYPHDMTWFNVPKDPQPGVVHKGYQSKAMDKQVGYNIYLPPGYESDLKRYPVVYWLHGRGGTAHQHGAPPGPTDPAHARPPATDTGNMDGMPGMGQGP